jgi:hypothetical protein
LKLIENKEKRPLTHTHIRKDESKMQQQTTGLEDYIKQILKELSNAGASLAKDAEWNSKFSAIGKVLLIFLGAFVATKEALNQLLGANSTANILIITVAGLAISVIAGLDAAFKWEKASADLKGLATTCQISKKGGESELQKAYEITTDNDKRDALEKLVDNLTKNLEDIYVNAATLGINIVLEIQPKKMGAQNGIVVRKDESKN